MIKKMIHVTTGLLAICSAVLLSSVSYIDSSMPDRFFISEGEDFTIASNAYVTTHTRLQEQGLSRQTLSQSGNLFHSELRLMNLFPVKEVTVQVVEKQRVAACGSPFGIKMFTDGVMVVGLSDLDTAGGTINPARNAGIKIGDVVTRIDGQPVCTNEQVAEIVAKSGGRPLTLEIKRKHSSCKVTLQPCKSSVDGGYKAGMWVRDSSAGIGTMTFYDPTTGVFGGLGHAVCDVDTGEILPLMSGEAVQVQITGVVKGESGSPGELQGNFYENSRLGSLYVNNETGVFGAMKQRLVPPVLVPIGYRQEVKASAATILTTLNGSTPQEYEITIEKVNFGDSNPTKNMVIRITDPRLLEKTGGIVQGMSGSPILQDGKLVGAVTHVFVNDPTRGYGIFAENMYYSVDDVENARNQAA